MARDDHWSVFTTIVRCFGLFLLAFGVALLTLFIASRIDGVVALSQLELASAFVISGLANFAMSSALGWFRTPVRLAVSLGAAILAAGVIFALILVLSVMLSRTG